MFDDWMKIDYAFTNSLQLHYRKIPRKIIAEKYLETDLGELQDYKFLCFDGKPYFCWVDLKKCNIMVRNTLNVYLKRLVRCLKMKVNYIDYYMADMRSQTNLERDLWTF